MTNQEAFYAIGNLPIPVDDTNHDICQYQEAKAIALQAIQTVDDIMAIINTTETASNDAVSLRSKLEAHAIGYENIRELLKGE